jgi:serpin B
MISTRKRPLLLGAPLLPIFSNTFDQPLASAERTLEDSTPSVSDADVATLVTGNTNFAFDFYDALSQVSDGNLFFSPYSVSLALAMTYAGARGETATQIAETLGFTLDQPALHAAFNTLNRDLAERGNIEADPGNYQPARGLLIANGVWGEQTYPFSETFSTEIERYYGTGLQMADFVNAPDDSREQINLWGEEQTKGRIQDIVPPGVITPATRLVLANAI